jgi:hypothetical protein
MREVLRARLARDAERKGITLNAEIVDRLEQSYANEAKELRDSAILDMMIGGKVDLKGMLMRSLASQLAKDEPNQSIVKKAKEYLEMIDENEQAEQAEQKGKE